MQETYSPPNSKPSPSWANMQEVEPANGTISNDCCAGACEPTAKTLLQDLIVRCDGTIIQMQAFRDLLPDRIAARPAVLGLRCIAHTSLEDIEDDIARLQYVRASLNCLYDALPKQMYSQAESGLKILINHYKFHLSRNSAFPN